jgi:hypothetical protein
MLYGVVVKLILPIQSRSLANERHHPANITERLRRLPGGPIQEDTGNTESGKEKCPAVRCSTVQLIEIRDKKDTRF